MKIRAYTNGGPAYEIDNVLYIQIVDYDALQMQSDDDETRLGVIIGDCDTTSRELIRTRDLETAEIREKMHAAYRSGKTHAAYKKDGL